MKAESIRLVPPKLAANLDLSIIVFIIRAEMGRNLQKKSIASSGSNFVNHYEGRFL